MSLNIWEQCYVSMGNGRRNKGASDERQECCGFAHWGNEREECVYGCEEGSEE